MPNSSTLNNHHHHDDTNALDGSNLHQRRHTIDGSAFSSPPKGVDYLLAHNSEESLKTKLQNCIRREHELKIQVDHEEEEKAEVLQKISFTQSELDHIHKESVTLEDNLAYAEDALKKLKLRQAEIWEQQQLSDTLAHQKTHKDWLLEEQKQLTHTSDEQAKLIEQQVLQTILTELQEEKQEIESKQEESRHEAQKYKWEIQQLQRDLHVPQEQVETLQVNFWHLLAGLQTIKEDFHDAEEAQVLAQLHAHIIEDKISDLEELSRMPSSERAKLVSSSIDYQRRLEAGKMRDGQLRAQLQEQEKQIRELVMHKIKLDRDWQRHVFQRLDQEKNLTLTLAEIAQEEKFLADQQLQYVSRLEEAMHHVLQDCETVLPQELATLQHEEQQILQELYEAEEQVRHIRSHVLHHDTSIQDMHSQELQSLRRQEIETFHTLQQLRRHVQTLTERDLPFAQLHFQRFTVHDQLLHREEMTEIVPAIEKLEKEIKIAEEAVIEAHKYVAIQTGVWKAAQKHQQSLLQHTPAMLQEAESQLSQAKQHLQQSQAKVSHLQEILSATQARHAALTSERQAITSSLQQATEEYEQVQAALASHEQLILENDAKYQEVVTSIAHIEENVSARIVRMEKVQLIGEIDALPRLAHLQQEVLPKILRNSLQIQAQMHAQHLRHQRFHAAWEGLQRLITDGRSHIQQLRQRSIDLQSSLHGKENETNNSDSKKIRLAEIAQQINQARGTRDRIVSSIRENEQDAIHVPQHRLLFICDNDNHSSSNAEEVRKQEKIAIDMELSLQRRQLSEIQTQVQTQTTTLSGITLKMKRLQAEIAQLWSEKLSLPDIDRQQNTNNLSSSNYSNSYSSNSISTNNLSNKHWPTILLHQQLRLQQTTAVEAQIQRVDKYVWSKRLEMVNAHQRQLIFDLQVLANKTVDSSSSALSVSNSSSSSTSVLLLQDSKNNAIASRHTLSGSTRLSQHAQHRQQQQHWQLSQRLAQELLSITQEMSRSEQRRFIIMRDWQEKVKAWLAWSEHVQHLTQDIRQQVQEREQMIGLQADIQRALTEKKQQQQQQQQQQAQKKQLQHHNNNHHHHHSNNGHNTNSSNTPTNNRNSGGNHNQQQQQPPQHTTYLTPRSQPYPDYLHHNNHNNNTRSPSPSPAARASSPATIRNVNNAPISHNHSNNNSNSNNSRSLLPPAPFPAAHFPTNPSPPLPAAQSGNNNGNDNDNGGNNGKNNPNQKMYHDQQHQHQYHPQEDNDIIYVPMSASAISAAALAAIMAKQQQQQQYAQRSPSPGVMRSSSTSPVLFYPVSAAATNTSNTNTNPNNDGTRNIAGDDGANNFTKNGDYVSSSSSSSSASHSPTDNNNDKDVTDINNDALSTANDHEEEEEEDVHSFHTQEFAADHQSSNAPSETASFGAHQRIVNNGNHNGPNTNKNRAVSPAFVAGSRRTIMTPKISSGAQNKGATPERPLRVSLNRTWSNQSISKKLARSTTTSVANPGNIGQVSSNNATVKAGEVVQTKKMAAMASARQQQSQQLDEQRKKNQQLASKSFQF